MFAPTRIRANGNADPNAHANADADPNAHAHAERYPNARSLEDLPAPRRRRCQPLMRLPLVLRVAQHEHGSLGSPPFGRMANGASMQIQ